MANGTQRREMTATEILTAVRSFADRLKNRGVLMKGKIPHGLREEIKQLELEAGAPFLPWRDTEYTYRDGKRIATPIGEALDSIGQYLLSCTDWRTLRDAGIDDYCEGWTVQDAENVIREAAVELPRLCDLVEALEAKAGRVTESAPSQTDRDTYNVYSAAEDLLSRRHRIDKPTQKEIYQCARLNLDNEIDREECGVSEGYKVQATQRAFLEAYRRFNRVFAAAD